MSEKIKRVIRPATDDERVRHATAREQAKKDFPPVELPRTSTTKNRIVAAIRKARREQGLSWSDLAKKAGISSANTVRDLEYGRDAKLSNVEAVVKALGLKLDIVEAS